MLTVLRLRRNEINTRRARLYIVPHTTDDCTATTDNVIATTDHGIMATDDVRCATDHVVTIPDIQQRASGTQQTTL